MPRRRTDTIGRAGEHYVAAELNRRGAYASPFSGNLPGIDIVATNYDKTSMVYIQVKTKREESKNWQVGLQTGWAQISPYKRCRENGKCSKKCIPDLKEPIPGKPDHYWIFVSLKDGGQEYYIVPDEEVRSRLVREFHLAYLCKHGGQRPGKKHNSLHHSFQDKHLKEWKDKWDSLGLGL